MPERHNPPADDRSRLERLEAYLDGLMDERQRAAFVDELRGDPALQQQAELQSRIDGALEKLFHVEQPSREQVAAALADAMGQPATPKPVIRVAPGPTAAPASHVRGTRLFWASAAAAAAAIVAWAMFVGPWRGRDDGPLFAARPLVEIYQDALASGFEPTYECREPERFAATFTERQGQPLELLEMPEGSRMLGLAYVGGLSRQTTAMLCNVDGQPVMAFVDRADADQAVAADPRGTDLHVFRQERDGLVFYEVTPLDEPRVLKFLATPRQSGDAAA